MSVNKVILLGYVGGDPQMRYPDKDTALAFVSLATDEKQPGGQDITEWHNLVFTGRNAEFAERYVRKGARLFVEGHLRTRRYVDRYKIERTRTEIFVDRFELLGRSNA